ncbi:uncharacterized protein LOC129975152 [Argiope bruennichi]|uniref:uncharacterized protein LOC129975152 n=1 Tax=Argiope bruennichi TaxID=94029 RepID=UPI0024958885|nr:uncharacterized protein LOC129975152 [Argiope bruennichi]
MDWSNEVGTVCSARMPVKIVQRAQYMNDAMDSVFGKFTQARHYQKNSEFRGGIWDCNPVEKTVPTELCYMDLSNNLQNKTYSLEEMLACDNEDDDTEMIEDDDVAGKHNKPAEVNVITSCTEVSVDVKNKRWRSEEFDKASLLPCNVEITRKKSKKNVSFSDSVESMENSSKPPGINKSSHETVRNDIDVKMKSNVSDLKKTVNCNEIKEIKNFVTSREISDVPVKLEKNRSVLEGKSADKESNKVKSWKKLISQPCALEDQLLKEQVQVKSSENSTKESSDKKKKNIHVTEHETEPKRSEINYEVKNEEFMNRNHLKNLIPELFDFIESETMDKTEHTCTKKKDQSKQKDNELITMHNTELKMNISQSSQENVPLKDDHSHSQMDLSANEAASDSFEDDSALKLEDKVHLKNLLTKFLKDTNIAERITTRIVKLSEQNNKVNDVSERDKNLSNDKQTNFIPMVRCDKSHEENSLKEQVSCSDNLPEDDLEYESVNNDVQRKKTCCPPVCEKSSCNQPSFQRNRSIGKDLMVAKATEIDENSEKASTTAYQGGRNFEKSISRSRSDSYTNWRSQCIDVRGKDSMENTVPQSSTSVDWRNECTSPRNQHYNASRYNNHYSKRIQNFKKQEEDVLSNIEYVDDNPLIVIPLNIREPPDPSTRFKENVDPESIWDAPEEKKLPHCNQTHLRNESIGSTKGSETEEVHAQFLKSKPTSIPRFFDNPKRTYMSAKSNDEISEEIKQYSPKKITSTSPVLSNENNRSRSHSRQENFNHQKSYQRNRSASEHWRSHLFATSLVHDIFFLIKITDQDGAIEKLKILKEDFLEVKRENAKLSYIIPDPRDRPRNIAYSANAVKMLVRCVFSASYKIPNWMTALEAFSLAKKIGIKGLQEECQTYFKNYKTLSEQIENVAVCAKQLQAVDALKSTKFFQKVQNIENFPVQNAYTPQRCSVSCSVLMDSSEFVIPLLSEIYRGLESCNETDVTNTLIFRSLTNVTCLSGLQLKFLTEDIHPQLNIVCEVFKNKEKLFFKEFDTKAKPSVNISFDDEIEVKLSEQVEISIIIEDVVLKLCPQLTDEFIRHEKFHARFESSKTSDKNKLFCIEKLFYT